jgi:hypothetical protein
VATYDSYRFKEGEKDPIIHVLETALKDDGINWHDLPEFSGVAEATYYSWFYGSCRSPKFMTVAATIRVLPVSTQRLIWKRLTNLNAPQWRTLKAVA